MSNTVMKDTAKAENTFISGETMRDKYMLREGIDISVIAKITSFSVTEIQQIVNGQPQL